ncbi:hypothetical protein [Streptomyces sp. ODS28]|uniref:hypothetical protein n=1 Tax=Streptomyces sp. ODS28 TaxID=3136688 RepID=UPI0031EFCA6B
MDDSQVSEVGIAWRQIERSLSRHHAAYHARLNPPADPALLRQAEHETGRPLPAAPAAWWSTVDGVVPDRGGGWFRLFPYSCDPRPLGEALARRRMHLEALYATASPGTGDLLEQRLGACALDPAGTGYPAEAAPLWLPQWLPVAGDGMGGGLFADLRAGPRYGCLIRYTTTGHDPDPAWPGIAGLLTEVARRME